MARLKFPLLIPTTLLNSVSLMGMFSAREMEEIIDSSSPSVGEGTRIIRQRLFIGAIILLDELQHKIKRRFELYFSIVLLSAC